MKIFRPVYIDIVRVIPHGKHGVRCRPIGCLVLLAYLTNVWRVIAVRCSGCIMSCVPVGYLVFLVRPIWLLSSY